jgi:hypothetical protein
VIVFHIIIELLIGLLIRIATLDLFNRFPKFAPTKRVVCLSLRKEAFLARVL